MYTFWAVSKCGKNFKVYAYGEAAARESFEANFGGKYEFSHFESWENETEETFFENVRY
jgi:hypothetical protein